MYKEQGLDWTPKQVLKHIAPNIRPSGTGNPLPLRVSSMPPVSSTVLSSSADNAERAMQSGPTTYTLAWKRRTQTAGTKLGSVLAENVT